MYGLTLVTPPPDEPVSLARAKSHLRVAVDDDDLLVDAWITAARELSETHTGRRWITQSLRLSLNDWPCWNDDYGQLTGSYGGIIRIPASPVTAVTAVKYVDTLGVQQTLGTDGYQTWLDHSPPLLAPAPFKIWPVTQTGRMAAVTVEITAGYGGKTAVPEQAKAAILLCVGYWYENRGDGLDPARMPESLGLPPGARRLLDSLMTGAY